MRLLSLVAGAALLIGSEAVAVTLQVSRPHIDLLGREAITAQCKGTDRLACTSIETRLISGCSAKGGSWRPVTLVQIDAHVYTLRADLVAHEFSHLADIRKAVTAKAATMESQAFAAENDCLGFLLDSEKTIPEALLEIETDSGHMRDPANGFPQPTPLAIEIASASGDPR